MYYYSGLWLRCGKLNASGLSGRFGANCAAQLHSLRTHKGAARRVVTSGPELRAAHSELGMARAACLYSVGRVSRLSRQELQSSHEVRTKGGGLQLGAIKGGAVGAAIKS